MAHTAALRVSTDTAYIYLSVRPKRARKSAPTDPVLAIYWHVQQICRLAEEYVCADHEMLRGHPARISTHKRKLAALGIDEISLLSFIHRMPQPA